MQARVIVENPEDHAAWVLAQTPTQAALMPNEPPTQLGGMP